MTTFSAERVHKTWVARWGKRTAKVRIFEKVYVDFATDCWVWQASLDNRGYGQVLFGRQPVKAHIVMYRIYRGDVTEGLTLDHLCRNTRCVNPEHLEPTTRAENTRRQIAAAGHPRSNQTHCSRNHELSGDNLRPGAKAGRRVCRACANENNQRYRARRKAAA